MSTTGSTAEDGPAVALDHEEEVAWRATARLLVSLPRALEADLVAGTGMGVGHYSVLMHLSEAPGNHLRIGEVARRVALSAARTSRLVDELGRDGLVVRTACPGDGRAVMARLTDAGLRRLQSAWPVHATSVRARLLAHATPAELATVSAVLARVVDAVEGPVQAG